MIRQAKLEDIKEIVRLGKRFFEDSHDESDAEYELEATYISIYDLFKSTDGILLVAEVDEKIVGFVGGVLFKWYFSSNKTGGQEMFWYVLPEYRGGTIGIKLLKTLEQEAKEKGATSFMMISEFGMGNKDYMDNLYKKLGYKEYETAYIRTL